MKKLVLLTVLFAASHLVAMAQDDLYFVPTKENVAKAAETYGMPSKTYYAGSSRSADEYNRRAWSRVAPIDSAGNDIIDFSAVRGAYPDSAYSEVGENDYKYTRRMSRFDDYTPSEAYWEGYADGSRTTRGWYSPWYYSSWGSPWYYSWYDPWYSSWYDPWYYGSWGWYSPYYSTWYSPWRYNHWGYYGGYWGGWYGGGPRYHAHVRPSGTGITHHRTTPGNRNGNLGGYRSRTYQNNSTRSYDNSGNSTRSLGGTRSYSSGSSGGSFGGGGASSGGGRSVGGGRSYGGRR